MKKIVFFSFGVTILATAISLMFQSQETPRELSFVVFLAFALSFGFTALNMYVTRATDPSWLKLYLATAYAGAAFVGIGFAFGTSIDPTISDETVRLLQSLGWTALVSVVAGLVHIVLLRAHLVFQYPPVDPPPQVVRTRPRLVK